MRGAQIGPVYGSVAVTAQAAQVVEADAMHQGGYYSVFKVLESNFGQSPEPFDKVAKWAGALLKRAEESRLAGEFLMGLRRDYQAGIVLHEDRLAAVLSQ